MNPTDKEKWVESTLGSLGEMKSAQPRPEFTERMLQQIGEKSWPHEPAKSSPLLKLLAAALALLILANGYTLLRQLRQPASKSPSNLSDFSREYGLQAESYLDL
ncbi:MAG: hypothetical protein H6581_13675 [Bacteroidia bacterium]|nr:hypothetical protein [Bacteroidia bacterium]